MFGTSSHLTYPTELAIALAKRNYNVTFVLPKKYKFWIENIDNLDIIEASEEESSKIENGSSMMSGKLNFFEKFKLAKKTLFEAYEAEQKNAKHIIYNVKPDLVICEMVSFALIDELKSKNLDKIYLMPGGIVPSETFRYPYIPFTFLNSKVSENGFVHRFIKAIVPNLALFVLSPILFEFKKLRESYGYNDISLNPFDFKDTHQLVAAFYPMYYSHAMSPYIHLTGGATKKPDLTIENDLLEWLDSKKKDSIIYIGFGSHFMLEENLLKILINASLKDPEMNVLISLRDDAQKYAKFNKDDYKEYSNRMMVKPWLNQPGVLNHPSVLMFISHGGYQSVLESLEFNKPMLSGISSFADQSHNPTRMEELRIGENIGVKNLNEKFIADKISKIKNNLNDMKQKIERMNGIRKSHGEVSKGVEVVEFVLKYGSKDFHLIEEDLNYFVRNSLDIYLVISIIFALIFYSTWKMMKCCFYGNKENIKNKVD